MSEIKDDPREVLVLLNSLGFVGITSTQLKAFMKDLKVYRKIKDREKQQRREEMRAKIIGKQQALIKEAYRCQKKEHSLNNTVPSESSNSFDNESLVKVKIRCIPKEKDEQSQKHSKVTVLKTDEISPPITTITKYHKEDISRVPETDRIYSKQSHFNAKSYPINRRPKSESRQNVPKCSLKDDYSAERCKHNMKMEEEVKPVASVYEYPANEPILAGPATVRLRSKSIVSDPVGSTRTQSALSTRSSVNSGHKSFIRPWRLQQEAQKNITNKKCDPVALYQKYQQEWKQISFPGEAKHSKVRWAVREKMLGADPRPMPIPRKSVSMPILKRK